MLYNILEDLGISEVRLEEYDVRSRIRNAYDEGDMKKVASLASSVIQICSDRKHFDLVLDYIKSEYTPEQPFWATSILSLLVINALLN